MLEDPPLLTIKRSWSRPDAGKVTRLEGVQTGQAVDAMDGRGALDANIKPIDPDRCVIVGPALTCETGPDDNLALIAAISLAQPGDIIVAASEGFFGSAVFGDNLALMARNKGVAGIVIDGMARDLTGLLPVGLPLFCRGITPNSGVRSGPGRVGFPIVAGGRTIRSGDIVIGDRDGIVTIPQDDLDALLPRIDKILAAEAETQAKIKGGFSNIGGIEDLLKSSRVRWME